MKLRSFAWLVLAGIAFGVAVAVVKGQDAGVRDALGNMSAPWVLLPFLAGARFRGVGRGALAGLAVTLAAFLGFYVAEAAVLDLGPHPWYVDLRLTLHWNVYETYGIFSGLAYGALGGLWATRRSMLAAATVGLAFVAEPLIVWSLSRGRIWGDGMLLQYRWLWGVEVVFGLAAVAYALTRSNPRPTEVGR